MSAPDTCQSTCHATSTEGVDANDAVVCSQSAMLTSTREDGVAVDCSSARPALSVSTSSPTRRLDDEVVPSGLVNGVDELITPKQWAGDFGIDGFALSQGVLHPQLCNALVHRLDAMLAGTFDTGSQPDKVPCAVPRRRPRVEQFVNAWKGDSLFSQVVHSERLAAWVAELAGWQSGAEVLQDQVWCKPPGSGPIGFHRDTAYMGEGVVTAWITLDDLEPSLGPLEYARGSHLWEPAPYDGYTPALFGKKDYKSELDKAAAYNNVHIDVLQVIAPQGGGSVHDGRTWHGSGVNRSKRPRRGLGIHFGPKGARPQNKTAFAKKLEAETCSGPVERSESL